MSGYAQQEVSINKMTPSEESRVAKAKKKVKCWPDAKRGWRLPGGVSLAKLARRIRDIHDSQSDALGSRPGLEWTQLCKAYQARHKTKLTAASFGFLHPESLLGTLSAMGEIELWYTYSRLEDDADWSPDWALASHWGRESNTYPYNNIKRHGPLIAAPRVAQPSESTDADPGSWPLSVRRLDGQETIVHMQDGNTLQDLRQKIECSLGLLPGQAMLMLNGVAPSDDMLVEEQLSWVSELRDATLDVVVTPPMITWRIGILAHVAKGNQFNTKGGAVLSGGEVVKVDSIKGKLADVSVWNPEYNQATFDELQAVDDEFEGFSDSANGVPLSCLVAATMPLARQPQVVPRHEGCAPSSISFVTPGVIEQRCTMCTEAPSRRDIGFCAPGSRIIVKVTEGGGGLDFVADRDANWNYGPKIACDLLDQRMVGPLDSRFHDLKVGRRRVALPSDPIDAARVLSEVRALAFAAGLLPGRVLIPAAFCPGFSLGQRVRRPVTGREGTIREYNRGSQPYRMLREKWSAALHEVEPVS